MALGVRCKKCKTFVPAGVWGAAHIGMPLVMTCPKCGHKNTVTLK